MSQRILLAGASGLIGREVLQILKARGAFVRSLSRDPTRAQALQPLADEVEVRDATAPGALAGLAEGIDVCVSALGAPVTPSARGRQSFGAVDRAANLALVEEAKRAKVRRFVYVGVYTSEAYAGTAYVRAHSDVEAALGGSGIEARFVRPTGVFGALAELVAMAKKGPLPLIGDGSARTNPVHELEVAEAVATAATEDGPREIDLGGPEILTRRRIAELAFEAIGARPRLIAAPVWVMRAAAASYGLIHPRMGELLGFVIRASTHDCVAPAAGTRTLGPYFAGVATASIAAKA